MSATPGTLDLGNLTCATLRPGPKSRSSQMLMLHEIDFITFGEHHSSSSSWMFYNVSITIPFQFLRFSLATLVDCVD